MHYNHKLLLIVFVLFYSCGPVQQQETQHEAKKPIVVPVNYPLYYFAKRIGGPVIQLEYPIPEGVDPAYWVPDDSALAVYQSANVILANGADYAKWMNNVSLPERKVVNTSLAATDRYIPLEEVTTHSHGPEGEHQHTGVAFTTWLNVDLAIVQAAAVLNSLTEQLPEQKEALEANYEGLEKDLRALDDQLSEIAKALGDQRIVASHPVYQYLAQGYGLNIRSVHFELDEMPSDSQWKEFDHLLEHDPATLMIWEGDPLPAVKERLNDKGLEVKVFNPCSNRPEQGDFLEVMRQNVANLQVI